MKTNTKHDERIAKMTFASVYPHYVAKVESKGRTKKELHEVIEWLTGFNNTKLPKPDCIQTIHIDTDERLFARCSDTPRFLEDKVKELGQRNWSWHNLRHRKASIWHNKEKRPLYEVMVLLGHSNLKTTQGYLQLIP